MWLRAEFSRKSFWGISDEQNQQQKKTKIPEETTHNPNPTSVEKSASFSSNSSGTLAPNTRKELAQHPSQSPSKRQKDYYYEVESNLKGIGDDSNINHQRDTDRGQNQPKLTKVIQSRLDEGSISSEMEPHLEELGPTQT